MNDFFEEYSAVILDHYQVSLATRELPYKGNQEHKERLKDYYERKRQLSQAEKEPQFSTTKPHHVSHIQTEMFDSDEDIPDFNEVNKLDVKANHKDDIHGNRALYSDLLTDKSKSDSTEELLAVMQQVQDTPATRFGCMKKILQGKCDKPDCKYSHNEATVMQTALDMRDKLDAYMKSHSSVGRSQTPVLLRRDHSGDPQA